MPEKLGTVLRARTLRKVDMDRALKAVKDAGLSVAGVKVGADGSFEVLTASGPSAQRDELEEWRARRDAHKAARP